ncbi:MAG: patatin-like phospholipase family protein [Xanthomonadales bacterium]|nr:patatin-like phospholipase family protein [Xanthomonadales bacterium]
MRLTKGLLGCLLPLALASAAAWAEGAAGLAAASDGFGGDVDGAGIRSEAVAEVAKGKDGSGSTTGATTPPCIGLVLGGGGARGAAHIGVLKVLERERVPICRIAGTSMGAIVGGLYASGYSPERIEDILAAIDWKDVLDDDPPREDFPMRRKNDTLRYLLDFRFGLRDGAIQLPRGLIQGQKLLLLLRRLTLHTWRSERFDDFPIPFRAVATDIVRGEPVIFDSGDLALAIRSSMSVPAAFAPLRVDGRLLVDGGIVNNVPVDVVRAMGAERLIVVDVGAPLADDADLNSPLAITMQMLDVLMKQRTAQVLSTMAPEDVKILPQLGSLGSADFVHALDAIPHGEAAAELEEKRLRAFAVDEAEYARWLRRHRAQPFDPPLVAFLDVLKHRSETAGYVERELDGLAGAPLDLDTLERAIGNAYAQGNYERIAWRPVERGGRTGIEVLPVDKGWGPNFLTFGLQISDDFDGRSDYQLGAEYTMTGLNRYGGEWRSRAEIGRITGVRSEFFQPAGERGQYFVQPYFEHRAFDQALRVGEIVLSTHRLRRSGLGLDIGWEPDQNTRWYAGIHRGHASASVSVGDGSVLPDGSASTGALRLGFVRDTLDDADFPGSGSRGEALLVSELAGLGSDGDGETFEFSWDKALSRGANRYLLGARVHATWDAPSLLEALAPLGGFTNLSGYGERELLGPNLALMRAVWYRRLGDSGELFSVPAFVGASLEAGNVYDNRDDLISLENLIHAGSFFLGLDSPFGPIFLGYGFADSGDRSLYLNFGTLLRPRL